MDAHAAFRALRGVFCVYKPPQKSMAGLINDVGLGIYKDINNMPIEMVKHRVIYNEDNIGTNLPVVTTVPDLSHHHLVVGQRYERDDFEIRTADKISYFSSGVVVMAINGFWSTLRSLRELCHMKVYHVKGQFGIATQDFTSEGKLVERSTYKHVKLQRMEHIIAGIQSAHQRYMFKISGVDLQSQEAYELATKGLLRPDVDQKTEPMLYNIKCIEFEPPYFTLEIHCMNETSDYLAQLIHEIGLELRTTAACTQVRRIRFGYFTSEHALHRHQWNMQSVIDNIKFCKPLVTGRKLQNQRNIVAFDSEKQKLLGNNLEESGHKQLRIKGKGYCKIKLLSKPVENIAHKPVTVTNVDAYQLEVKKEEKQQVSSCHSEEHHYQKLNTEEKYSRKKTENEKATLNNILLEIDKFM